MIEAPVTSVIEVAEKTTPSICAPAPRVTASDTAHTMFSGRAPPRRITLFPVPKVKVPAIWRIQAVSNKKSVWSRQLRVIGVCVLSVADPSKVRSVGTRSPLVHLWRPGARVSLTRVPNWVEVNNAPYIW